MKARSALLALSACLALTPLALAGDKERTCGCSNDRYRTYQEYEAYLLPPLPGQHWCRWGCGQGKTHHDFGCTGCRADAVFVFGSCCQFFEEPCSRPPYPAKERRSHGPWLP
jgi:hypothetical protein